MKYFSPNYWIKLWLLSAPLFNSKNEGIYAKSIDNKNIKDWASNNTNLELIENQTINLSNNQSIQLQNNENITSSKNLETDDFYENFLKTQGWSNNPEIAQQQIIDIKEEQYQFLKEQHNRIKKQVTPNPRPRTTATPATTTEEPYVELFQETDASIINNELSDNNRHYENTLSFEGGNFFDARNLLLPLAFPHFEQNYGFRMLYNWFFVNELCSDPTSSHIIRGFGQSTSQLFPDNNMLREYNRYFEGYDMRQDALGNFYDQNGLRRYMSWKGTPILLYDRYLLEINNRWNRNIININNLRNIININNNNNLPLFRSPVFAFQVLNEIFDEAFRENQDPLNLRYYSYNNFRTPILADPNRDTDSFQDGRQYYFMRNRVRNTFVRVFSRHFHQLITLSLRNNMPFIFLTNINNFPREMFVGNRRYNRASDNYFAITGASIYDQNLENVYYQIFDPINRNTYHINGDHFLSIVDRNYFNFAFGYDNARQTLRNGQIIIRDVSASVLEYVNFERDYNNFNIWSQMVWEWIHGHADSEVDMGCDTFEKFKEIFQKHKRNKRNINPKNECILNSDAWHMKLRHENIYNIFTLNMNNQDNSRKKWEKFVSTDKGFYFVNLNNEIVKIGDFKKIVDIIADNQGSVYIADEFTNRYHINLYDWDHTNISSNILIDDDSYKNVIDKIATFKNINNELPIVKSLHQVQEDEYNDETSWAKNDIFVGTDQGFYLYNYKEKILDKFSNLNTTIKNFQLTNNASYAINQQGKKNDLDLFNPKNYYIPNYHIDPAKDFKEEYDAWGSNNKLKLHISYNNVMYMIHSFLYNNKNNFVNYFLNGYLNKLNISDLFNKDEINNIVNAIWKNFSDFHEKSLNMHDGQSLVLHIDGKGNWLEDNIKFEEYHPKQIIVANRENYNFKPAYEIESEIEDKELQIIGQLWHSNEVMFRISHYNIHQMFKSFTYNLKNDFINNFIDGFLKKLSIKKFGSFLNRDYFYDDYYKGLANTIWNNFGDFHEQALSVKRDQAIYFDMYALHDSLDGALSIVKDHIHRYNIDCTRYTDSPSCHKQSNLLIKSKDQLLSKIRIYNENKNISKRATNNFINKIQKINSENFNNQTLLADELQNTTPWEKNITNLINHEQHLPIYNTTNFVKNNITSL